jgi:prevent-host-death family protein
MAWELQEAKTRLGEVIEQAHVRGPQIVTRCGVERAVVLSIADCRALVARKPNLIEYLLGGPKAEGLKIEPSRDMGREVDLR